MNILITGASGFIGKSLVREFKAGYFCFDDAVIFSPSHSELDLTNKEKTYEYVDNNKIDFIIHCAVSGLGAGVLKNFTANMLMYQNLVNVSYRCKLMCNFCSGAAFGRNRVIDNKKEIDIFSKLPKDFYGLAKNLISRDAVKEHENVVNLRLFGCFGDLENPTRFIKNSFNSTN